MAAAILNHERLLAVLHYNPNTGIFIRRISLGNKALVGSVAGSVHRSGYVRLMVDGTLYLAHRLAWFYMTGQWPRELIDHINMDRADNRWANLRDASAQVNQQNKSLARVGTASGLLGVWRAGGRSKKWTTSITANGVRKYLGKFATPELAHAAYIAAKRALHEGCTI